jgi:hypothetical protein
MQRAMMIVWSLVAGLMFARAKELNFITNAKIKGQLN